MSSSPVMKENSTSSTSTVLCSYPMVGTDCRATFASILGWQYLADRTFFAIVGTAGLIFTTFQIRRIICRGGSDTQRATFPFILLIYVTFIIGAIDPVGYNNVVPYQTAYLVATTCLGCIYAICFLLVGVWASLLNINDASMRVPRAVVVSGALLTLFVVTTLYATDAIYLSDLTENHYTVSAGRLILLAAIGLLAQLYLVHTGVHLNRRITAALRKANVDAEVTEEANAPVAVERARGGDGGERNNGPLMALPSAGSSRRSDGSVSSSLTKRSSNTNSSYRHPTADYAERRVKAVSGWNIEVSQEEEDSSTNTTSTGTGLNDDGDDIERGETSHKLAGSRDAPLSDDTGTKATKRRERRSKRTSKKKPKSSSSWDLCCCLSRCWRRTTRISRVIYIMTVIVLMGSLSQLYVGLRMVIVDKEDFNFWFRYQRCRLANPSSFETECDQFVSLDYLAFSILEAIVPAAFLMLFWDVQYSKREQSMRREASESGGGGGGRERNEDQRASTRKKAALLETPVPAGQLRGQREGVEESKGSFSSLSSEYWQGYLPEDDLRTSVASDASPNHTASSTSMGRDNLSLGPRGQHSSPALVPKL